MWNSQSLIGWDKTTNFEMESLKIHLVSGRQGQYFDVLSLETGSLKEVLASILRFNYIQPCSDKDLNDCEASLSWDLILP